MQFTVRLPAGEHDRFAPTAGDNMLGKGLTVRDGASSHQGRVVAVEVVEDGRAVDITVEVDTVPDSLLGGNGEGPW